MLSRLSRPAVQTAVFRRSAVSSLARKQPVTTGLRPANRLLPQQASPLTPLHRGAFYSTSQATVNSVGPSSTSNSKLLLLAALLAFAAGMAGTLTMNAFRDDSKEEAKKGTPESQKSAASEEPAAKPVPESAKVVNIEELPVITDTSKFLSYAPNVPPPVDRDGPARLIVDFQSTVKVSKLSPTEDFEFWTFNDQVPGPFIRCRVGDVLEIRHNNIDSNGVGHNIDFHCATGPGGGAPVLYAEQDETKVGWFRMLDPGLYIYHCAAAPVPAHIANGMYGLVLVEPEKGLPPVDKEFYVLQSEFYTEPSEDDPRVLEYSHQRGLDENPSHVVFNGREGALTDNPLMTEQGDRVRIYFGNAGPNLVSSFHVIGAVFDHVYREGDLISPPARALQTTLVPAGGATVVEFDAVVPGNYTLVDHSIFRLDKGCVGFLKVKGPDRKDIYGSRDFPNPCPNCKLHS